MLMSATAGAALLSAATWAQDHEDKTESATAPERIEVEGQATADLDPNAPRPDEAIHDNDLFRAIANIWDNSDLDRAPYTDDHEWVGLRVNSSDGERIGDIERVRLTAEGQVEAVVIEHGGLFDIGGRETQVETEEITFVRTETFPQVMLSYTEAQFLALPDFNEDAATESPLSDDDYNDNENEMELDDGPATGS